MCTLVYIHTVDGKSVVAIQATAIKVTNVLGDEKARVPCLSYVVCVTRVPVMADDKSAKEREYRLLSLAHHLFFSRVIAASFF